MAGDGVAVVMLTVSVAVVVMERVHIGVLRPELKLSVRGRGHLHIPVESLNAVHLHHGAQ